MCDFDVTGSCDVISPDHFVRGFYYSSFRRCGLNFLVLQKDNKILVHNLSIHEKLEQSTHWNILKNWGKDFTFGSGCTVSPRMGPLARVTGLGGSRWMAFRLTTSHTPVVHGTQRSPLFKNRSHLDLSWRIWSLLKKPSDVCSSESRRWLLTCPWEKREDVVWKWRSVLFDDLKVFVQFYFPSNCGVRERERLELSFVTKPVSVHRSIKTGVCGEPTDDGVDAETSLSLSLHLYLSSPPLHFILTLTFGQ